MQTHARYEQHDDRPTEDNVVHLCGVSWEDQRVGSGYWPTKDGPGGTGNLWAGGDRAASPLTLRQLLTAVPAPLGLHPRDLQLLTSPIFSVTDRIFCRSRAPLPARMSSLMAE